MVKIFGLYLGGIKFESQPRNQIIWSFLWPWPFPFTSIQIFQSHQWTSSQIKIYLLVRHQTLY